MGNLSNILNGPFTPPEPKPVAEQLRDAMLSSGIEPPPQLHIDGNIHRFSTSDNGRDDAGWYIIYPDGVPAGRFGDWRTGEETTFRADVGRPYSAVEEMQYKQRIAESIARRNEEKDRKHKVAANTVSSIWSNGTTASPDHPYLKRKGIGVNGARVTGDGRLMVPLFNSINEITSIQYISSDGQKMYHAGGAVKGCHWMLGDIEASDKVFVAEGFATAATIYEETGQATAVAYSAGNLELITGQIKEKAPEKHVVIVADNDKSGVGHAYADQAAAKHGASVVLCPESGDINDYRANGGNVKTLLINSDQTIFDRMKVITGYDLTDEYEPPDEMIEGICTFNSLTVIYGDSNAGKTFWAMSMAAAVCEGEKFHGRQVDQGAVVYLAAEAPGTIRTRMQAIKRVHGWDLKEFFVVQVPTNFYTSSKDVNGVIELCKAIEAKIGKKISLIIGDTLARIASGANENSGEDMAPVMERFDMVAKASGASLVIIHHNGKNKAAGARGWSGIRAHIDTEIEVEDENGLKSATIVKQRQLGGKGSKLCFNLKVIQMGVGKFGNDVTDCVAIWDSEREEGEKNKGENLDIHEQRFFDCWVKSGMDFTADKEPFVTRDSIIRHLESDGGVKNSTTYLKTSPTATGGGKKLNDSGAIIKETVNGEKWVFKSEKLLKKCWHEVGKNANFLG